MLCHLDWWDLRYENTSACSLVKGSEGLELGVVLVHRVVSMEDGNIPWSWTCVWKSLSTGSGDHFSSLCRCCFYCFCVNTEGFPWGWKDDSWVKSTDCSCGGPSFDPQHSCGSSQSVTPVSGYLKFFSGLSGTRHTHGIQTYMQTKHL